MNFLGIQNLGKIWVPLCLLNGVVNMVLPAIGKELPSL